MPAATRFAARGPKARTGARYRDQSPLRAIIAMLLAVCGGLALLFLIVYPLGGINWIEAGPVSLVALALAAVWFLGFAYRHRTGALRAQRPDRERRGF